MGNPFNKISFAYVTLAQAAMTDGTHNYLPQMLMKKVDSNTFQIVIVTVGMLFSSEKPFAVEADILFNGESVIDPDFSSDDKLQVPLIAEPELGQIVNLSHLQVNGVRFKETGIYQVKCCLAEDMDKLRSMLFVDTLESFFYVEVDDKNREKQ
ncbi:TPA: hypothetical protein O1M59_001694 [Klebsiella variicola]|nr:hypothetical protein [Klebsiella variicola]